MSKSRRVRTTKARANSKRALCVADRRCGSWLVPLEPGGRLRQQTGWGGRVKAEEDRRLIVGTYSSFRL